MTDITVRRWASNLKMSSLLHLATRGQCIIVLSALVYRRRTNENFNFRR